MKRFIYVAIVAVQVFCSVIISNELVNGGKGDSLPIQHLTEISKVIEVSVDTRPFQLAVTEDEASSEPSMYETMGQDEIDLIEAVIQHEVGAFSKEYKTYVAELIYNRIVSDRYPNTATEVLFQEGQFQGIKRWWYLMEPDNDTVEVVREVFISENPSHDGVFYYNPELSEYSSVLWFEYSGDLEFVFEYTEISWGIAYTTRFFKEAI